MVYKLTRNWKVYLLSKRIRVSDQRRAFLQYMAVLLKSGQHGIP